MVWSVHFGDNSLSWLVGARRGLCPRELSPIWRFGLLGPCVKIEPGRSPGRPAGAPRDARACGYGKTLGVFHTPQVKKISVKNFEKFGG